MGSYYVKLEGQVDALVFAGGIGEKGGLLRSRIVDKCKCLGFDIDDAKNPKAIEDVVQDIGKEGAKHRTLVCQTDEQVRQYPTHVPISAHGSPQFEMARGCAANPKLFG